MHGFIHLQSKVVPIDKANVDTDGILPKQFLKSVQRTGFGPYLFDGWRYLDEGRLGLDCSQRPLNRSFSLNQPRYRGAQILLARENFGCGSSREHAVWALDDYGIRAVIAPRFADIFFANCLKNGLLPVQLRDANVDALFIAVQAVEGYCLTIDLPTQTVTTPDGCHYRFELDAFRKRCLLENLDDVALTLGYREDIKAYEAYRYAKEPWIFSDLRQDSVDRT
jgi:3-isopropylmalate/(R)-2-methylmalate dehydratase small subunit